MVARPATLRDVPTIVRIYNQGIEDRTATFETRPRGELDVAAWFDGVHPICVVEQEGEIVAFASTSSYSPRECYRGIAEFSVYVAREARGKGAGRIALQELIRVATESGYWKLVSRVFAFNTVSRGLCRKLGFREVGCYEKHAQLDGKWLDVVIVERLLP
jgi:phosphinothricin acetyltransferase